MLTCSEIKSPKLDIFSEKTSISAICHVRKGTGLLPQTLHRSSAIFRNKAFSENRNNGALAWKGRAWGWKVREWCCTEG